MKHTNTSTKTRLSLSPIALAVGCLLASSWFVSAATAQSLPVNALPTQGQVVQGQINIQTSGNQMQVQQGSQTGIINWGTYDIGANAGVRYVQPNASASTLNRVANGSSEIAGRLQSNGKVFLLNPNGVLFSPTAQVDVGSLTAAAATTTDAEYLSGNMRLNLTPGGQVLNQGHITAAQGGQIVLAASHVDNSGTLTAPGGQVGLLAGEAVRVNVTADGLIQAQLESSKSGSTVSNTGLIEATGLREQGGVVYLVADQVSTTGGIKVSSDQAQGGVVSMNASNQLQVSGSIEANGTQGGRIDGTADQTVAVTQAKLQAQGTQGTGGVIRMGGDFQGGAWRTAGTGEQTQIFAKLLGNTPQIKNTQGLLVDDKSTLNASGAQQGGVIILWSDQFTSAQGALQTLGQGGQGQGGAIEVSSHGQLYRPAVSLFDPGKGGVLLLDPRDLYVVSAYGSAPSSAISTGSNSSPTNNWFGYGSQQLSTGSYPDSAVLASDVSRQLNAGHSVLLMTVRDLYVNATISASSSSSDRTQLQLEAGRSVFINQPIYLYGPNLGLKIIANNDANGTITADMRGSGPSEIKQASGATIFAQGSVFVFQNTNSAFNSLSDAISLNDVYSGKTLMIRGSGAVNLVGSYISSNSADTTAAWISGNNLVIESPVINIGGQRKTVLYATGTSFDRSDLALTSLIPFQTSTTVDQYFSSVKDHLPDSMVMMIDNLVYSNWNPIDVKTNFTNYMITSGSWFASTPTEMSLNGTALYATSASRTVDIPTSLWQVKKTVTSTDLNAGHFDFSGVSNNLLVSVDDSVGGSSNASVVETVIATVSKSTSSTPVVSTSTTTNSVSTLIQVQTGETSSWRPTLFASANQQITKNPNVSQIKECADAGDQDGGLCIAKPRAVSVASVAEGNDGKPATPIQKRRALVIGNASYLSPLGSLAGVSKDAQGVTELLGKQGYEVIRMDSASRSDMVKTLNDLIRSSEPDDSVLVYYAGHGHIHPETGNGYWLPSDASIADASTWLSNTDIVRFLKNIPAKQLLLVSDSCFSGTLTRETEAEKSSTLPRDGILKRRSVVVMSSGGEEPVADMGKNGYSPFAGELIRKLSAVNPQDEERAVSVLARVRENLKPSFKQTPFYGALPSAGHVSGGEYLFGRNGVE